MHGALRTRARRRASPSMARDCDAAARQYHRWRQQALRRLRWQARRFGWPFNRSLPSARLMWRSRGVELFRGAWHRVASATSAPSTPPSGGFLASGTPHRNGIVHGRATGLPVDPSLGFPPSHRAQGSVRPPPHHHLAPRLPLAATSAPRRLLAGFPAAGGGGRGVVRGDDGASIEERPASPKRSVSRARWQALCLHSCLACAAAVSQLRYAIFMLAGVVAMAFVPVAAARGWW